MKSNPAASGSSDNNNSDNSNSDNSGSSAGEGTRNEESVHAVAFQFAFSPAFRAANMLSGVRPSNSSVTVDGDNLRASFGRWQVITPLSNVAGAQVSGPYFWPKVIGVPHLSAKDRGLTFGTNAESGVCIEFHEPVKGIDPWGLIKHPGLTVTVADPAALAELLEAAAGGMSRTHGSLERPEDILDVRDEVDLELRSMTAAELRSRAADRGIERTSRMNKTELIEALEAP